MNEGDQILVALLVVMVHMWAFVRITRYERKRMIRHRLRNL